MTILTCEHLCLAYDGYVAVDHINFSIDEGDYLAIIGGNGSGKSTLMKGLLGLKVPLCGTISYEGVEAKDRGYLPQVFKLNQDFPASVEEVVLSGTLAQKGRRLFYGKADREQARKAMAELGISDLGSRSFRDLSGGQQQRVLLARALCGDKKMLFLDEPIKGLDPKMTEDFYQMVRRLNRERGLTIIHITHDVRRVVEDASKVLQLNTVLEFFGSTEAWTAWQRKNWEEGIHDLSQYI